MERRVTRRASVLARFGPLLGAALFPAAIVWLASSSGAGVGPAGAGGFSGPVTFPVSPVAVGTRPGLTRPYSPAAECATCHREYYDEWRRSVMAYAARSPLFLSLEMQVQEQAGRSFDCPEGAGVLRRTDGTTACTLNGQPLTGTFGQHWCIYCHVPADGVMGEVPPWQGTGRDPAAAASRRSLTEVAPRATHESIGCDFCHTATRGARPGDPYVGNDAWRSPVTGARFAFRAGDEPGIANSGYHVDPGATARSGPLPGAQVIAPGAHDPGSLDGGAYLRTSEFCGSCHDVRLFGTDAHLARGGPPRERFKRLRNAYSEWRAVDWSRSPWAALGRAVSCQECHMSLYPGVCEPLLAPGEVAPDDSCPPGTRLSARPPGATPEGPWATNAPLVRRRTPHYLTGVDVPLAPDYAGHVDDADLDASGLPRGFVYRRRQLLRAALRMSVGAGTFDGVTLRFPLTIENVGTGHNVPAGFSQEREIWVELEVTDGAGRVVYRAGQLVDSDGDGREGDEDLGDKRWDFVETSPDQLDAAGRPVGLFGAVLRDGPDRQDWRPAGPQVFAGRGLVNLQNGYLRCVVCDGAPPDPDGFCRDAGGDRYGRARDGAFDVESGACTDPQTGLPGHLIETFFPISGLRPQVGVVRAHDGLLGDRALLPFTPRTYQHELPAAGAQGPFTIRARLRFRAFPPFLVRSFAGYEANQASRGRRAGGPLVTLDMLDRIDIVEVQTIVATVR